MHPPEEGKVRVAFAELIELAAEKVGGKALIANDPSHQHDYEAEPRAPGPFTHVRLNLFPDGGISRLRVHGRPA